MKLSEVYQGLRQFLHHAGTSLQPLWDKVVEDFEEMQAKIGFLESRWVQEFNRLEARIIALENHPAVSIPPLDTAVPSPVDPVPVEAVTIEPVDTTTTTESSGAVDTAVPSPSAQPEAAPAGTDESTTGGV